MAQQNPAQGLIDDYKRALNFIGGTPKKAPTQKQDTSWHDSMVKAANDSFRKLSDRNLGGKKKAKAKRTRKPVARKKP